jgi:hypothetical protein
MSMVPSVASPDIRLAGHPIKGRKHTRFVVDHLKRTRRLRSLQSGVSRQHMLIEDSSIPNHPLRHPHPLLGLGVHRGEAPARDHH